MSADLFDDPHFNPTDGVDHDTPMEPPPMEPPEADPGVKDDVDPPNPVLPSPPNHSGQVRMAYWLAAAYEHRLLHVHGIGWHRWDGARWAVDDGEGYAKRAVLSVLRSALAESLADVQLREDVRKCESHNGIQGVLGIAAALEPFAVTVAGIDADPYLVNCANGTLDLRTMELRPHDPADRITKVARAAYGPVRSGMWSSHIERVLPDEPVRAYLQRLIGVALLGRVTEHVLPILTGTGANGKGTTYKAVCWALGDYASTAEPDLFMHREGAHPTGEMDLMGRRLIVVSESDEGRRLAEATMKRLTGGDTIRARRMRRDFVEFEPSHMPLLITNHLPKVSGDDPAVWRRIRVIPFDVTIPEADRDSDLEERLQADADAVLSWAVAGWRSYRALGALSEPDAVLARTADYQKASDAVGRFLAEMCVTGSPVVKATTAQLFSAWEKWRVADGAEMVSQKAFGQALDRLGYPASNPVQGKRWRSGIGLIGGDSDG